MRCKKIAASQAWAELTQNVLLHALNIDRKWVNQPRADSKKALTLARSHLRQILQFPQSASASNSPQSTFTNRERCGIKANTTTFRCTEGLTWEMWELQWLLTCITSRCTLTLSTVTCRCISISWLLWCACLNSLVQSLLTIITTLKVPRLFQPNSKSWKHKTRPSKVIFKRLELNLLEKFKSKTLNWVSVFAKTRVSNL